MRKAFVYFSLQFDQLKQNLVLLFFLENALVAFAITIERYVIRFESIQLFF